MRAPKWIAGRHSRTPAIALLLILAFTITGCAATGGNERTAVADDPEAQCRAAIAAVNERCAGEGADSQACENAKNRVRDLCIP
jgi:hypothetical protein